MDRPFLSIVMPAYNEEGRILAGLETAVHYLGGQDYSWELLVVDDGSTDSTASVVSEWAKDVNGVRIESIPHGGKGWAVKHGMLNTTGQYRFMCDVDLAMPIQYLEQFLDNMAQGYDIVIGSRQITGARRFDESPLRHAMGRVFNTAVRLFAIRQFHDTQCGFKCFKGEVADELFGLQKTKGFGFDVEILYLALKRGMSILEMPIDWYHRRDSKVRPGLDSLLMLRDISAVRISDAIGKYKNESRYQPQSVAITSSGMAILPSPVRGTTTAPAPAIEAQEAIKPQVDGRVAVVVPTYNEASNLPALAERLFSVNVPIDKLIIVDDNSPDGTAEVVKQLDKRFGHRLELIQRKYKQGLGTAYIVGFTRALEDGADYVLQMDADLSHAPEYIPAFLQELQKADVVVGSRYVEGGGVDEKWSLKRRLLSSLANIGIRKTAGLKVKDSTTGFKGFRADVLRSIRMTQLRCKGFGFQAEVAYACQKKGYRVVEYPIIFYDRERGESKMSLNIAIEAIWRLILLRWRRQE